LEILVNPGPDQKRYFIRTGILSGSSTYLKTQMEKGITTVRLPNISPVVFDFYVEWLYNGRSGIQAGFAHLADLWQVGHALKDTEFMNASIKELVHVGQPWVFSRTGWVRRFRSMAVEGTGLQCWLVDHIAANLGSSDLTSLRGELPYDLVFDVLEKVAQAAKSGRLLQPPKEVDEAKYYESTPE
jgi:hypothetical protein